MGNAVVRLLVCSKCKEYIIRCKCGGSTNTNETKNPNKNTSDMARPVNASPQRERVVA